MSTKTIIKRAMSLVILIVLTLVITTWLDNSVDKGYGKREHIFNLCEFSYMQGQVDALKHELKISAFINDNGNTDYKWITSPWDTDRQPGFNTRLEYQKYIADKTLE